MAVSTRARWLPLIVLIGVLALTFAVLLIRGLDLGFTGDLLDYAYHYDRLGTFGGMQWLVTQHLHRHLLAGLFSAPIAYLFRWQSAAWYGYAFLVHFANAVMVYALATTIQRGQRRWLSLAAALIFTFYALQVETNLHFPTSGHRNSALFLALLSLWFYLQYVRRGRRNRWWRELSLAAYVVALMVYEQTVLFFLLHPLIAYFEDRYSGALDSPPRWLVRVALDSLWFPVFVAGYLFLLRVLFPPGDDVSLAPHRLFSQIAGGVQMIFSPAEYAALVAPALIGGALIAVLAIGAVTVALIFVAAATEPDVRRDDTSSLVYLTLFGLGIIVAILLGAAPTSWIIPENPRIIYPAGIGFAMLVTGGAALLLSRVPSVVVRRAVVALIAALLVGTGAVRLFQWQDVYRHENDVRRQVLTAIHTAIPALRGDELPYFLLLTDVNPTDNLYLFAQDIRFPLMFDQMYDTTGIAADAVFYGLDRKNAPGPDTPGKAYNGQFIVVDPDGLYSPVMPHVAIDPTRLVIVQYDSQTGKATVLDQLPPDVLERGNLFARAPMDWKTNQSLIVKADESP